MTGDEIPVVTEDPFIPGRFVDFENPRNVTFHGYKCPCCAGVIEACHDAGLLAQACLLWASPDPGATLPPVGFEIIGS